MKPGTEAHARVIYEALSESRQDHWLWRLSRQQLYSDLEIAKMLLILPADVHAKIARGLLAEDAKHLTAVVAPTRIERRIGPRDRRRV